MWIYVCSLSRVSVRTVTGCAVDKQQYSNALKLSNKPSSVPAQIRKLANNSSPFHILCISDNKPAGLLCVQGEVELMDSLFASSFSPAMQVPLVCYKCFYSAGSRGEYRPKINKCGSPLSPSLTGSPWAMASPLCNSGSSCTKWEARLYG